MTEKQLPFDTNDFRDILGDVPTPLPSKEGKIPDRAKVLPNVSIIDQANLSERTKYKYKRELIRLSEEGIDPLKDYQALTAYANKLKSSRKAFLKSALRLMSQRYKNELQAKATPQNLSIVDAAIHRIEAMQNAITIKEARGTKARTWLSPTQVRKITSYCGNDLEGKRDWIVLGLLLGAGLHREELVSLKFDALKEQRTENRQMRKVLKVTGKGAKDRVIPISQLLAERLRDWHEIVGGGLIARSLGMKKELGDSISAVAVFQIVRKYGKMLNIPKLSPHDLRRTYAHLGYDAGVPIMQIKELLGHASVATTQKYLDLSIDFENTASDFVPLSGD